jgi:hypothetical protein
MRHLRYLQAVPTRGEWCVDQSALHSSAPVRRQRLLVDGSWTAGGGPAAVDRPAELTMRVTGLGGGFEMSLSRSVGHFSLCRWFGLSCCAGQLAQRWRYGLMFVPWR